MGDPLVAPPEPVTAFLAWLRSATPEEAARAIDAAQDVLRTPEQRWLHEGMRRQFGDLGARLEQERRPFPRAPGAWEEKPGGTWHRRDGSTPLLWVWHNPRSSEYEWARLLPGKPAEHSGRVATLEEAQAAADAVLRAEGWVL